MKVFLIRHGEALSNVSNLYKKNRHETNNLTGRGLEQARLLGNRFKNMDIEAIYSSDIPRAIQTAKEILKYHPDLELIIDERLREHNPGESRGGFNKYINEKSKETGKNPHSIIPLDGESYDCVHDRFTEFFEDIKKKYTGNVMVVAHGTANIIYLKGPAWTQDLSEKKVRQPNTCVNEIEFIENGNKVHRFACIDHLTDMEKLKYFALITSMVKYKVIPYEEDLIKDTLKEGDCRHKTKFLKNFLDKEEIESRELIAIFNWEDLPIPQEILNILKKSTKVWSHSLLEVKINNEWIKVDVVWDRYLKKVGFPTASFSTWFGRGDLGRISWGEVKYIQKEDYKKEDYGIVIDKEEAHLFADKLNEFLESMREK